MSKRPPIAFMSYARSDDEKMKGSLTRFREHLSDAVELVTGEEFQIFQDRDDIKWGQNWKKRIQNSIDEVTFLIPIITPRFFKSEYCKDEVERFIGREKELKRDDFILPVYYVGCRQMDEESIFSSDPIAKKINEHNWTDWRKLRFESFDSSQVQIKLAELAEQIRDALERVSEEATQESDSDAEAMQEKSRSESEKQDSKQKITNVSPNERSTPAMTATPTPTPTPEGVTVEPTGKVYVTRIMGYKFGEPSLSIYAGDTLQWYNLDDDTMTLVEIDGKIPNQTVKARTNYVFNTAGTYIFQLFYPKMRVTPPTQTINVHVKKDYENSIGMKFVLIQTGEFMMGSDEYNREKPVHKVTISKPFYLGIYPVTQKEWKAIMEDNPSYFKGDNLPVEQVSWNDVQEFIKLLNEKEGANKYRLPTEAEWEYAARAGTTTRYSFGDDESNLGDYAWYISNSGRKTHEVGQKNPNPWGLYDMHGNVWEWVQDNWHVDDNYNSAPTDGSAWESSGSFRVFRGGGWYGDAGDSRSAFRGINGAGDRISYLGFRLMRIL